MALAFATPSAASVDRLRAADTPLALRAALIVGTALLTGLLAQFDLRIYLWEVPLTLQTLAVYGSGLFLGWRTGALAMLLYLALGLVLPMYAGGGTGLDHLLGASMGYLVAFPLVALIVGGLTEANRGAVQTLLALVAASLVLFSCGVIGLHLVAGMDWADAAVNGWLRFVPWDLTKIALIASLYIVARRATT